MYERHFGLTVKPFALTPDSSFLFKTRQHAMALTMLEYGLESEALFAVLTGDIGCGKTTVVQALLRQLGHRVVVGMITHTHDRFHSIHGWALSALGIACSRDSEIARHEALAGALAHQHAQGRRTLLIVDEAQNLSIEILEELRLLSNINSEGNVLLQVLLVGQPELRAKLSRPDLLQFAQRVSVFYHLRPLTNEETVGYIRHRLEAAEGDRSLFLPEAMEAIYARSGGIPRLINQLCDYALVYAFAERKNQVGADTISQVVQDCRSGVALRGPGPNVPILNR
jgi:general secretion pathway protein A